MAEVGPAQLLGPEWAIFGVWTRLGSTHIDYPFLFSDNGSIWTLSCSFGFLWVVPSDNLVQPIYSFGCFVVGVAVVVGL